MSISNSPGEMMDETNSESLVNLFFGTVKPRPPSVPKPKDKTVKPRRASAVRSPYLVTMKIPKRTTCIKSVSGPNDSFNYQRRKASCDNDFTKDFAGKTALDLRDDLTDAHKILRGTCEERDDLKSEVMKLKSVIERREKEIEDLLMGGHVSQKDQGRLSAASKQDTLLVMSSLKHRIHILERTLRHKEEELLTLKKDLKTSRVKELETEKELELNTQVPHSKKFLRAKVDQLNSVLVKLKEKMNALTIENTTLKKQLGRWRKEGAALQDQETDEQKFLVSKYLDMTQGEVITNLIDKEMKLQEVETKSQCLADKYGKEKSEYETKLKVQNEELLQLKESIQHIETQLQVIEREKEELEKQCVKHKTTIDITKQELSDTKNSLQTEKTSIEEMLKDVQRNEELATKHLRDISNHKRNIKIHHNKSQHDAALVIQKEWRQYISNKKQKQFEADNIRVTHSIQNIFRSHCVRKEFVKNSVNDEEHTDSVASTLQNLVRGHKTRQELLHSLVIR